MSGQTAYTKKIAILWHPLIEEDGNVTEADWVKFNLQEFDRTIPEFVKMEQSNYEGFHASDKRSEEIFT